MSARSHPLALCLSVCVCRSSRHTERVCVCVCSRHMLNVTWERKDLSFNSDGYLTNPSMAIIALDRDRLWDKVLNYMRV